MPIFAFTDIEGSTGLWERHQGAMGPIIARHYAILEEGLARFGGRVIKKTGDGVFALFPDEDGSAPSAALGCALGLQRRFQDEPWPVIGELRVRMAFHCGQAEEMAGDYYGPTANRTARFMALGWGGQILVSEDLQRAVALPEGAAWVDHGVHMVKDLPEPQHVFSLTHPSLRLKEFPALKSLSTKPHNLPEQASPFVGRRRELQALAAFCAEPASRLLTLVGGGGMGKTRLAIQAALDNLGRFKHGVHRAGLLEVAAPEQLAERLALSLKLGLSQQKAPRQQVLEYLGDKQLLLLLDPCERLGPAAAFVSELLQACPGLKVLAASRRRLQLRGEAVLEVRGLDYPLEAAEGLESSGCAQLFLGAARALQPGYAFTPAEKAAFVRLCRLVRGLPLGLELAAELMRGAPLKELVERVAKDPRILSSAGQDRPVAHRGLRALFESAWMLLNPAEKKALGELACFRGSFEASAAQAAFQVRPELLAALGEQGLLEPEGGRLALSEVTRLYALAKLDLSPPQREAALDAHARHFLALARGQEAGMLGAGQLKAVSVLRQALPDLQAAWERAVERGMARELGQAARTLGLVTAMQGLARDQAPRLEAAQRALEGAEAGLRAALLAALADNAFAMGRAPLARQRMEQSLTLCRQSGDRSGAAYALVRSAVFLGPEDERRQPALEEAARLYQGLGDANGAAWARRNLGYLLCMQGRVAQGRPLLEAGLEVFRGVGNLREVAWSLNSLGQADLEEGKVEQGMQRLGQARDAFVELGDLEPAAWTLNRLGRAATEQRLWGQARAALEEGLELFDRLRHARGRALALRGLCEALAGQGDTAAAAALVDKVIAEAEAKGDLSGQAGALVQKGQLLARSGDAQGALAALRSAEAAFDRAGSNTGQALALEAQAGVWLRQKDPAHVRPLLERADRFFAEALAKEGEARVAVRLGDLDAAEGKADGGEACYQKALRLSRQHKPGDYTLGGLLGMALVLHRQGRHLEALQSALACERALALGLLPASDPDFLVEMRERAQAVLGRIGSKLLSSVIEEARAKMEKQDARAVLKDQLAKGLG